MSQRCLAPPFSSSNATTPAENPSTRTFSGEFNFYDTLRSIQFSIRRLFSQNLNGLGNKKSLCGHHSITHSTTVRVQDTEPDLFAAILKPIFSALGHLEIDLKMPKLLQLPVKIENMTGQQTWPKNLVQCTHENTRHATQIKILTQATLNTDIYQQGCIRMHAPMRALFDSTTWKRRGRIGRWDICALVKIYSKLLLKTKCRSLRFSFRYI